MRWAAWVHAGEGRSELTHTETGAGDIIAVGVQQKAHSSVVLGPRLEGQKQVETNSKPEALHDTLANTKKEDS